MALLKNLHAAAVPYIMHDNRGFSLDNPHLKGAIIIGSDIFHRYRYAEISVKLKKCKK